jgi:hypothetical protein
MTSRERRAAEVGRVAFRTKSIRTVYEYLAHNAAPTVVGVTLILPDGTASYISGDDAAALHGKAKPGGRA